MKDVPQDSQPLTIGSNTNLDIAVKKDTINVIKVTPLLP